jgi:PilZ domain
MNHHDRIHPRVTASTRVDWCVAGGATHVVSNLANVSSGGAFVRTCIPAPVGASVDICLLTEIGDIPASGRVAWTSPTGMGIAFH